MNAPSSPVRVVLFGFGVVGQGVLRLALTKPWLEVVGVIVRREDQEGRPAAELVPEAPGALRLSINGAGTLDATGPDVVLVATCSTLTEVLPHLEIASSTGAAVACTAEELGYIKPDDGPEASQIFELAERRGVAIVGLGMNPGFLLDVWPLVLSSIAHDIASIDCLRIVDVSGFGPRVRSSLGIGYTADAFERELDRGQIEGHIGFRESLRLVGDAIDRPLDRTTVETRPIFAQRDRVLSDGVRLTAGLSAGARQVATGSTAGKTWLRVEMTVTVALDELGAEQIDRVHISGGYELTALILPGAKSVTGTLGRIVNALPAVSLAPPGVHSAIALGITPARSKRW
jgi:hypothetical protein